MAVNQEHALLGAAVRYALAAAVRATPRLLSRPTPCPGWDLEALLDHLGDSMGILREALATGDVGTRAAALPETDPVARLRGQAAGLLAAAEQAARPVIIGDRRLSGHLVALAGAIEISVHGWDITVACGAPQPVPPVLAAVLLPLAPLLITPVVRPGLFADPVRLPGPACPGDQLIAFLGRRPRLPIGAPGPR